MIPPPLLHTLRAYVRHAPGLLGKPWLAGQLSDYLKHHPLTATARTCDGAVYPVVTGDVIQWVSKRLLECRASWWSGAVGRCC